LHDRAFDVGILAIDDSFRILVSSKAKSIKTPKLMKVGILEIEGQKIDLPARFDPDPAAIEFHRKNIFKFQNNEKEEGRF
jgi:predicted restriction endonuclease